MNKSIKYMGLIITLILTYSITSLAKETIRIGPNGASYHYIDEYFGEGESDEARAACDAWRATVTDPDITCVASGSALNWWGGWDHWPQCFDDTPKCKHYYLGQFHFEGCPDGYILDREEGCIEPSKIRVCEVETEKPISIATGTKYRSEAIDVGNPALEVVLNYTSDYFVDSEGNKEFNLIAPGWSIDLNSQISPLQIAYGQEYVVVKRPKGHKIRFNKTNGDWVPDLPIKEQLTEISNGWQLITDEAIETFEYDGFSGFSNIKTKQFYSGKTLTFEYSGTVPKFVNKVIDDYGDYIEFKNGWSFHTGFRIYRIDHSDGRQWTLGYGHPNQGFNLTSITYPDATVRTFHYEDPNGYGDSHMNALTGITDRRGIRATTYDYDAQRRVIYEKDHGTDLNNNPINVEEINIVYNQNGSRTITNSRGNISTYEVQQANGVWLMQSVTGPGCSSCSNDNTSFVYDPVTNDLLSKSKDGVTTEYGAYDDKGQYGYKIEAVGTAEQRQIGYTYDSRFIGKITSITEPSIYYDPVSFIHLKQTNFVYDANGQMTAMTENGYKPDGSAISRTTSYEYNGPFNQISKAVDPLGNETVYLYYPNTHPLPERRNRLKRINAPDGIFLRKNIRWSVTGKVTEEQRPNGITITNSYDLLNDRLQTSTQSDGTKSIVTQFTYLATGHIETVTRNYGTAEATTLTLTYDGALRVNRVTDQVGNYVEYELDTEGNQLGERTYDPNAALKKQITQIFDAYDLVDSMTQSGVTADYNYGSNGVLNDQVNGNNVTTEYSYDSLKRLSQINQDYNGSGSTANTTTGFTYDAGERVETVTDARGNVTTYNYDDFGNLISLVSPDTGTSSYVYDAVGNMIQKTDANGVTVNMTYDGRNRITSIDYADNNLDVSYVYDQGVNSTGRLSSFTDQTGSTTYSYDSFGNLVNKTQVVTGFNDLNISYSYDAFNRLTSMAYPSGVILNYEYDDLNQVKKITTSVDGQTETVVDQVTYLPFGPINSINYGNGKNYSANYDDGYRLMDYNYGVDVSATHAYDNNHNITAITREMAANNDSFSYDDLDRLTYDSHNSTTLSYDKLGNRTSIQQMLLPPFLYNIDGSSNKLLNVGTSKPRSYDANGNTLYPKDLGAYRWIYNQANRMSGFGNARGSALIASYHHNGIGQRVHKKYNNEEFLFVYDEQGQLVSEAKYGFVATGSRVKVHLWDREIIWLGNRPVAQVRTQYHGGFNQDIYYLQTDHLNTPRWITDDAGVRIWSWESDAFGTTLPNEDVDGDSVNFEFNMRFPGQYYDIESGMHYNYFRDYEPATGRYLESDPIGLDGGWNTFGYVGADPINSSDRYGLKKEKKPSDMEWWSLNQECGLLTCREKADKLMKLCRKVGAYSQSLCYTLGLTWEEKVCPKLRPKKCDEPKVCP